MAFGARVYHLLLPAAVVAGGGCSTVEGTQDDDDTLVTIGGGTASANDGQDDAADEGTGGGDDSQPGPDTSGGLDDSPDGDDDSDDDDGSDGPLDDDGTDGPSEGDPWSPAPGTTWQWQLTDAIDTTQDVEVYDIDLFDVDTSVIDTLHGDGRIVICYFSAGSYEEWRPDADLFPEAALGDPLDDWPGERWLDYRDPAIRDVMMARLDLAVDKQCDAVEPDNVDGYANPNGVGLSGDDQLDYNAWLAQQAHARGLSVGLKNDLDQLAELADSFDWALNEECMQFDECATLTAPFIDAGKAVFHVEYVDVIEDGSGLAEQVCANANALEFSTMVKQWDLGAWGIRCWD